MARKKSTPEYSFNDQLLLFRYFLNLFGKTTLADLAGKLSISQNAISQYENGKRCPPISRIANIAKVLGCSISDIVSDSDT